MTKNTNKTKKSSNCRRSSSPVTNRPTSPPAKRLQLDTSEEQQQQQQQALEASTSTFNNNENTSIEMEVEATSTSSPQDKGKGPEQTTSPVKNTLIDLDQSFDAAENMLDTTQ
jgi:hypothetical protein